MLLLLTVNTIDADLPFRRQWLCRRNSVLFIAFLLVFVESRWVTSVAGIIDGHKVEHKRETKKQSWLSRVGSFIINYSYHGSIAIVIDERQVTFTNFLRQLVVVVSFLPRLPQ